jgi:hypothetical protein
MSVQTVGSIIGLVMGSWILLMFTAVAVAHVLHKLGVLPLTRSTMGPPHVADFHPRRLDFAPRAALPRFRNLAASVVPSYENAETDPMFVVGLQNHHFDLRTLEPAPDRSPTRFYDAVAPIAVTSGEEMDKEPPGNVKLRYDLTRR